MPVSDIVLLLGAVGVLITTIAGAIMTLRRVETVKAQVATTKAQVKVTKEEVKATKEEVKATRAEIKEDVEAVHKIVNQHQTDMLAYQQVLVDALKDRGINVPRDVSVETPEKE